MVSKSVVHFHFKNMPENPPRSSSGMLDSELIMMKHIDVDYFEDCKHDYFRM